MSNTQDGRQLEQYLENIEYQKRQEAEAEADYCRECADEKSLDTSCKHEFKLDGGPCIYCRKTFLEINEG